MQASIVHLDIFASSLSISTQLISLECSVNAKARDYAYLIELTCMGSQSSAKAATTTNTRRVTRFRPRCDSFVRLCGTTVRHSRNMNAYSPLIRVNGIKYELEKNMMWKAANEMPPLLNTQNL